MSDGQPISRLTIMLDRSTVIVHPTFQEAADEELPDTVNLRSKKRPLFQRTLGFLPVVGDGLSYLVMAFRSVSTVSAGGNRTAHTVSHHGSIADLCCPKVATIDRVLLAILRGAGFCGECLRVPICSPKKRAAFAVKVLVGLVIRCTVYQAGRITKAWFQY